jgi:hypothetical protein
VITKASQWGLQHAWRRPQPGEPLHPEHLLRSATQAINHTAAGPPAAPADVTITATTQALTALIFTGTDTGIDITGEPEPVQRFRHLIRTMATVVHPA